MQIDGLEREQTIIAQDGQCAAGSAWYSGVQERRRTLAFRRILLVADEFDRFPDAFSTACALLERAEGEIILLMGSSQFDGIFGSGRQEVCANRASEVDVLELCRPTLNAACIDQVAQQYDCDLTILMMHWVGEGHRLVRGCMAEEAFRRLQCPTVVIGPKTKYLPFVGTTDRPIVFATSFRGENIAAIGATSRVAKLCGAPLQCVHVLPADMAETVQGCHVVPQIMRNALIADARRNRVKLGAEQCHILYGSAVSEAVISYAEVRRARFVALGIQQGGVATAHLPAGITSSIVASAPCPVLVVASQPANG